jgi:hypothetical protein
MIDLVFVLIVGIAGMLVGEIVFLILKYFMMKEHRNYQTELKNLDGQLEKGTISKSLYQQMQRGLERKYHVARYRKLGGVKENER